MLIRDCSADVGSSDLHPPRSVAPGAGPGARRTRAQYDRIALNGPFDPWRLEREIGVAACHLAVRVACGTIGGGIGEAAFLRRPTRAIGAMIDSVHGGSEGSRGGEGGGRRWSVRG